MNLQNVLELIGGLALFLYGMNAMGNALEKSAGNKLKTFLAQATSNPIKGFLLGLIVTVVIQSSSATTVMVVGFVNSGLMTLLQSVGVILGANLGTSITAWILSLESIDGGMWYMQMFKPDTFVPILAIIGVILFAFQKNAKRKDIGMILLGFAILMFGMDAMSGAVGGLKDEQWFADLFLMFENPFLGVIAGALLTAVIQSSSASVGILQALSATGQVNFASALPIIMGQNIGTCVTALISSVGTGKNARRAAIIHLLFNTLGTVILLPIFYLIHHFANFAFMALPVDHVGVAMLHTGFNICAIALLAPFGKLLVKISMVIIPEGSEKDETKLLDERFFTVPSVAIERSRTVAVTMAEMAVSSIHDSLALLDNFNQKEADRLREVEGKVDVFEDKLGSYLVKLSSHNMSERDSNEANKLLHVIGDFERLSDHALNIVESAEEIHDKNMEFSGEAKRELKILIEAVKEIIDISLKAFRENDLNSAIMVEPLEQVVDDLRDTLKKQHISRLRRNECTIELGFVLSDLLTNLERISDHCSNIAGCELEIAHENLDIHQYLSNVKGGSTKEFNDYFDYFKLKYALTAQDAE